MFQSFYNFLDCEVDSEVTTRILDLLVLNFTVSRAADGDQQAEAALFNLVCEHDGLDLFAAACSAAQGCIHRVIGL